MLQDWVIWMTTTDVSTLVQNPYDTYCCYATLNEEFEADYPYILGPKYYGIVSARNTGPLSGHNVVPSDALLYSPTATIGIEIKA